MEPRKISKTLLKRLPVYLNHLKTLPEEEEHISATAIANALGLGAVQVRKDLAKISSEGRRRTGRSKAQLIRDIEEYLDCTASTTAVIVGAGTLGQALLDYSGVESSGLNVVACFDMDPGPKLLENGKPVYSLNRLSTFCRHYDIRIGIIAVGPEDAQAAADALVACGIQAIWNFAPVSLNVPAGVILQNENFAVSISSLRMRLKQMENAPTYLPADRVRSASTTE